MKHNRVRVDIEKIQTGVPNLDAVLGGGLPAFSLNIVAGAPGTGMTILTQQILFHAALLLTVIASRAL